MVGNNLKVKSIPGFVSSPESSRYKGSPQMFDRPPLCLFSELQTFWLTLFGLLSFIWKYMQTHNSLVAQLI